MHAILALHTAVVCDMIPADYYSPSNFGWDAHGLFAGEEGIDGEGKRTLDSEMRSDWFAL